MSSGDNPSFHTSYDAKGHSTHSHFRQASVTAAGNTSSGLNSNGRKIIQIKASKTPGPLSKFKRESALASTAAGSKLGAYATDAFVKEEDGH